MTGHELRVIVDGMMNDGMAKHEVLNVLGFSERTLRRYVKQEEIDKERVALINERLKAHESHSSSEQPTGGGAHETSLSVSPGAEGSSGWKQTRALCRVFTKLSGIQRKRLSDV